MLEQNGNAYLILMLSCYILVSYFSYFYSNKIWLTVSVLSYCHDLTIIVMKPDDLLCPRPKLLPTFDYYIII